MLAGISPLALAVRASTPTAVAEGPVELFPDPTLVDVADDTNGWSFVDGFPILGPAGGTGPGISADEAYEDAVCSLTGSD